MYDINFILSLFLTAAVALSISAVVLSNIHKNKLEELSLYQIHVQATIDESIPEVLDLVIRESFSDYQLKSLYPLNEGYINSDREAEIRSELIALVSSRISNAALDKISLFYNITNIAGVIADKIYIAVMNYVIEHNRPFND